jgi:hypothetical protein
VCIRAAPAALLTNSHPRLSPVPLHLAATTAPARIGRIITGETTSFMRTVETGANEYGDKVRAINAKKNVIRAKERQ